MPDKNINKHFDEIAEIIINTKNRVLKEVNNNLIDLYWNIGKYISVKTQNAAWGKSTVLNLATYLEQKLPDTKGFSAQNLWRMKQFYETYFKNEKPSTLLREISWSNNLHILSKTKSFEEKEFYIQLAIKEKYSARELERQIDSSYFERVMLTDKKLSAVLRELGTDVTNTLKDNYVLEFLNLPQKHSELDLRLAIIENLKSFILEFGKDFTFAGQEYRVQIGKKDFYIDLLFYHRELRCLVAIELKTVEFQAEFLGKLNLYLEALDRDVKKPHENPSVGIILCKNKDNDVVEYALSRNMSPALIAEYQTKLIDKKILEQKLHEFAEINTGKSEEGRTKN